MHDFTPIASSIGGALLGVSAAMLLLLNGRVAGVSGIFSGLILPVRGPARGEFAWRALFIAGLLGGGLLMARLRPESFANSLPRSTAALVAAGLLVGFGTRLAKGCTSGHGLCGVSRFAKRSVAATAIFMATGFATAFVIRHFLGGAL
jgi:uncharacterized membrane protein YedE/YeeE